MNEPVTPSPEGDRGRGYEATDVNVWYVMAFGLGLALMVIAVLPLMISTFRDFERKAKTRDVERSPLARSQQPPAPRLEARPSETLAAHRRQEEQLLHEYRWIDKEQGVAQIPVERAMQLLVERGLPEPRPAKPQPPMGEGKTSKEKSSGGKPAADSKQDSKQKSPPKQEGRL